MEGRACAGILMDRTGLVLPPAAPAVIISMPVSEINALRPETFEKCSISFKFKKGENFNHRACPLLDKETH